jgi:ribosomal-protein-alanine N-acetyltransferase
MDNIISPYSVRIMIERDVPAVTKLDREAFPNMEMPTNFERELKNCLAHYIVACRDELSKPDNEWIADSDSIIGYAGLWVLVGEAHVVNIAVKQDYRGRGIGELLLISLFEMAIDARCNLITLEVRSSNYIARKLYEKYGFTVKGVRPGYYLNNREDAVIMTVNDIKGGNFEEWFKKLKREYCKKWGLIRAGTAAPLSK